MAKLSQALNASSVGIPGALAMQVATGWQKLWKTNLYLRYTQRARQFSKSLIFNN